MVIRSAPRVDNRRHGSSFEPPPPSVGLEETLSAIAEDRDKRVDAPLTGDMRSASERWMQLLNPHKAKRPAALVITAVHEVVSWFPPRPEVGTFDFTIIPYQKGQGLDVSAITAWTQKLNHTCNASYGAVPTSQLVVWPRVVNRIWRSDAHSGCTISVAVKHATSRVSRMAGARCLEAQLWQRSLSSWTFFVSLIHSVSDGARVALWIPSQPGSLSLQRRPGRMHMPQMTQRRSEQIHSAGAVVKTRLTLSWVIRAGSAEPAFACASAPPKSAWSLWCDARRPSASLISSRPPPLGGQSQRTKCSPDDASGKWRRRSGHQGIRLTTILQSVVLRAVRTLIRPLTRSNASHSFRGSLEIPHRAPSGFGGAGSLATSAQAYLRDGVSPRLPQSDTLRRRASWRPSLTPLIAMEQWMPARCWPARRHLVLAALPTQADAFVRTVDAISSERIGGFRTESTHPSTLLRQQPNWDHGCPRLVAKRMSVHARRCHQAYC